MGVGVASFCAAAYGIVKTLGSGTARLRGGRRVTRAKNPALYWTNVAALGVLMVLSLVVITIALQT
jgi:hypothetical protein